MVDVRLESITPEMAAEWLQENINNRNLRMSAVQQYARDITHGDWMQTGDAIKFSSDGVLLDGQHRLMAIVKADKPVSMFVARGVMAEAQKVIDTNIRRSVGDMLKLHGYTNHMNLAAAARLAMVYETDVPVTRRKSDGPTYTELFEFIQNDKSLVDAVQSTLKYRNTIDVSPSVTAVAYWALQKLDAEACETFFETIASNKTNGVGDPRNTFIQRLASARRQGENIPQNAYLSMYFRTWNAWVRGQEMFKLQLFNNREGGLISIPTPVKPS